MRTFNGQRRSLGGGNSKDFELAISAKMREHLHLFKGSSWNVFTYIALHIDQHGWAWPTVDSIQRDVGRDEDTVYRALKILCGLKIRKARVMLRTQQVPPHVQPEKLNNKRPRNFYLIFPSKEEIELYESDKGRAKTPQKSGAKIEGPQNSGLKKRDPNFAGQRNTISEDTPSSSEEKKPHTHNKNHGAAPEPPLFAQGSANGQGGVCVRSEFDFEQRLEWAEWEKSQPGSEIKSARSVAAARADGLADEQIRFYFASKGAPPADKCDPTCPLCFGTNMQVVPGKGARKCPGPPPAESDEELDRLQAEYEAAQSEVSGEGISA